MPNAARTKSFHASASPATVYALCFAGTWRLGLYDTSPVGDDAGFVVLYFVAAGFGVLAIAIAAALIAYRVRAPQPQGAHGSGLEIMHEHAAPPNVQGRPPTCSARRRRARHGAMLPYPARVR